MFTLRVSKKVIPILTILLIFSTVVLILSACQPDFGDNNGDDAGDDDAPVGSAQFLVLVPAGPFYQGSDPEDQDADGDEMVIHPVVVSDFHIFGTEVTNGEYQECVSAGECEPPQDSSDPDSKYGDPGYFHHPVTFVDWFQAREYCEFVEGRLPTEAEWEKAARGTEPWPYPWGVEEPDCDRANSIFCEDNTTHPVGSHPTGDTPLGVADMAGNVMEWTLDTYHPEYYLNAAYVNPTGPTSGEGKVVRGGSFESGAPDLRTTARMGMPPEEANPFLGFRCVPQGPTRHPPFCLTSYVPSCIPRKPPPDDMFDDDSDDDQSDDDSSTPWRYYCNPDVSILTVQCPKDGAIQVTVETGMPSAEGFSLSVNGVACSCTPSSTYPSRLNCSCPYTGGSDEYADFHVCTEGGIPSDADVETFNEIFSPVLVSLSFSGSADQQVGLQGPYTRSALKGGGGGLDDWCPAGYVYEAEGICVKIPNGSGCPPGTHPVETDYGGKCAPEKGDCPDGWELVEYYGQKTCEPDNGCPAGYVFNPETNCCEMIYPDNPCDEGEYFDYWADQCKPHTLEGCPEGEFYDPYWGCVPFEEGQVNNGDVVLVSTASRMEIPYVCPPGTVYYSELNCCVPLPGFDGTQCPDGEEPDEYGFCPEPDGEPECDEGWYLEEIEEGLYLCIPLDENGCEMDEILNNEGICEPFGGLLMETGPCPLGFYYVEGVGCFEICDGQCWDFSLTVPHCTATTCDPGWKLNEATGQCEKMCSSYKNKNACESNGCDWYYDMASGSYKCRP